MNISTRTTAALATLALAAGLSACATDEPAQSSDPISTVSAVGATTTTHNAADVTFAQMMTIHHEGALEMSTVAVQKADATEVRDLAAEIEAAQGPEIESMESWLTSWDEPLEAAGHEGMDHGGMDMNGKSQEEVMAELQQLSGTEFDEQFLTAMIAHHEGAVMMSEEELQDGQDPDALELAAQIVDAQEAEIEQMQQLLQNL